MPCNLSYKIHEGIFQILKEQGLSIPNFVLPNSVVTAELDKTYYYGSFYLATYPMDGKDYVYTLWFADDTVATADGIRIGSTQAQVETVYGADAFNGTNAFEMTKGSSKLTILITDGIVSGVRYEGITD